MSTELTDNPPTTTEYKARSRLSDEASPVVAATSFNLGLTIRGLLGFSRALVATFVVAQAGLAAVFALNGFPTVEQIILGFIACFTGASALIAYNDLLDVDLDRTKLAYEAKEREAAAASGIPVEEEARKKVLDLGALLIHHPVARGIISYRLGVMWVLALSSVSMYVTYLMQPWLPLVYVGVAVFVTVYSRLSRKSPMKMLAVATAVTLGGIAGWMAVADPPYGAVFWLFAVWTFVWEIGGRNLPNDFNDVEEDEKLGIMTLPVVYGKVAASRVSYVFLLLTVAVSLILVFVAALPIWVAAGTLVLGVVFLLEPGYKLLVNPEPDTSRRLYNRSAAYTPAMLLLLAAGVLLG